MLIFSSSSHPNDGKLIFALNQSDYEKCMSPCVCVPSCGEHLKLLDFCEHIQNYHHTADKTDNIRREIQ